MKLKLRKHISFIEYTNDCCTHFSLMKKHLQLKCLETILINFITEICNASGYLCSAHIMIFNHDRSMQAG